MTHIVTSLCVRDRGCIDVCPVECMVPGFPLNEWPWIYIDPDTCIDCGACVPECPFAAIFPEKNPAWGRQAGTRLGTPSQVRRCDTGGCTSFIGERWRETV